MRVLYHVTMPPSSMARCDAVVQDIEALKSRVPGFTHHLYPSHTPGTRWPRRWWGMLKLPYLRQMERRVDLHHIFNPDLCAFLLLRWLRRPIVYTVVAGTHAANYRSANQLKEQVNQIVVPADGDLDRLQTWHIPNVALIRPGIEVARFSYSPPPSGTPFTLLMASAPWTLPQFQSKGVDALLEVAQRHPGLRLVFLWRGVLFNEMQHRVRAKGLETRVEIINEVVDVNAILSRVHAAVVFASDETLIKAYPHSLLEALAAGKPVIISRIIPMAEQVERCECGQVVDHLDVESVHMAVAQLMQHYETAQRATRQAYIPSRNETVATYIGLYGRVLASNPGAQP